MRVIDSSVLVKYFSGEKGWERARKYLVKGATTLDLAIKEVSNTLRRRPLIETRSKTYNTGNK